MSQMKINRTVSWYRSNLTGSSLYAVDAGYTVVAHAVYDPWGAPRSSTYTDANFSGLESMLSYSSYSWDVTLELYYAQARMYSAGNRRFTTQDPARDGTNWYAYCGNNPLVYADLWGTDAILINKAVDNPAGHIGIEHMSAFFQDSAGEWWYFFWGDIVITEKAPPSIFTSLASVSSWILDVHTEESETTRRSTPPKYGYHTSVYIPGDFTISQIEAKNLFEVYDKREGEQDKFEKLYCVESEKGDLNVPNDDYKLLTNNCGQVTMRLLFKGILPGVDKETFPNLETETVGVYAFTHGYGINTQPNTNIDSMQKIFYNTALTRSGFDNAMRTLADKYNNYNAGAQWWYRQERKDLAALTGATWEATQEWGITKYKIDLDSRS
jgi:RHS repeat-associated protein